MRSVKIFCCYSRCYWQLYKKNLIMQNVYVLQDVLINDFMQHTVTKIEL